MPKNYKKKIDLGQMPKESLATVLPFIPEECSKALEELFQQIPVQVKVKKPRKTKHGDHQLSSCRRYSIITINNCGNRYQFLLTLLHEFAHAETYAKFGLKVSPHGKEWKAIFRKILLNFCERNLFPDKLSQIIRNHAVNPKYSSAADIKLQQALRPYDTSDQRKMVSELPHGQTFSLDGKHTLIKQEKLRTWYKCTNQEGKAYRVSGSARVHSIIESSNGATFPLLK